MDVTYNCFITYFCLYIDFLIYEKSGTIVCTNVKLCMPTRFDITAPNGFIYNCYMVLHIMLWIKLQLKIMEHFRMRPKELFTNDERRFLITAGINILFLNLFIIDLFIYI